MKKTKIYQVDTFTDKLFSGNPAAVCLLDTWINDEWMQLIGNENNLAETAFVVPNGQNFEIRWFTPTVEVDLCGHATLAAAFVLFNIIIPMLSIAVGCQARPVPNGVLVTAKIPQTSKYLQALLKFFSKIFIRLFAMSKI